MPSKPNQPPKVPLPVDFLERRLDEGRLAISDKEVAGWVLNGLDGSPASPPFSVKSLKQDPRVSTSIFNGACRALYSDRHLILDAYQQGWLQLCARYPEIKNPTPYGFAWAQGLDAGYALRASKLVPGASVVISSWAPEHDQVAGGAVEEVRPYAIQGGP